MSKIKLIFPLLILLIIGTFPADAAPLAQVAPLTFTCISSYDGSARSNYSVTYLGSNRYQFTQSGLAAASQNEFYCSTSPGFFYDDTGGSNPVYTPSNPQNSNGRWYILGGGYNNGPNPYSGAYSGFYLAWGFTSPLATLTVTLYPLAPTAEFSVDPNSGNLSTEFEFTDQSSGYIESWTWDFDDGNTSTDQNPSHTYAEAGEYDVELCVENTYGSDCVTHTITVVDNATPGGNLYEPVVEFGESGMFDAENVLLGLDQENMVYFDTPVAGEFVYAISTGTVVSVEPLTACAAQSDGIEVALGDLGDHCVYFFKDQADNHYYYEIVKSGAFVVKVSFDTDRYLYYLVREAPIYVRVGATLRAGCIVGVTMAYGVPLARYLSALLNLDTDLAESILSANDDGFGMVWLSDDANLYNDELYSMISVPVDPNNACNSDPDFAACLGDPQFLHQADWESYGSVQWLGDGIGLGRNASISYPLILSSALQYSVTVIGIVEQGTSTTVSISLGGTSEAFTVGTHGTQMQIDAHTPVPDSVGGRLYTLTIMNTGSAAITIYSNCVTDGTPSSRPGTCYFNNYNFDNGLNGWTTTGSVLEGEVGAPYFFRPGDTGQISQNMELYPDGASEWVYLLEVETRLLNASAYSGDSTSTISLEYRWAGGSWTPLEAPNSSISGYPYSSFITSPPYTAYSKSNNVIVYHVQIPVATYTSGVFDLRVVFTSASGSTQYLEIRSVCINDPFNNFPDGDGVGIDFPTHCGRVEPPVDMDDIGAWTFYHWSNLDRFFQCELMIELNRIVNIIYDGYRFMLWQMLYYQELGLKTWNWVGNGLIPYVSGHLSNIARGQVTTIDASQCNNLFCALDSFFGLAGSVVNIIQNIVDTLLDIINLAVTLLLNTVQALLALIFSVLGQVFNVFFQIVGYGQIIVGAYNNTNEPIDFSAGIIDERDPGGAGYSPTEGEAEGFVVTALDWSTQFVSCGYQARTKPICITVWLLEHTVFAHGRMLFIYLMMALAMVYHLIWLIKHWKELIAKISGVA